MNCKYYILILVISIVSCKPTINATKDKTSDNYRIIEMANYGNKSLFFKTLSINEILYPESFSYEQLNRYNVRYNSITEKNRFVNFDTIFSQVQQRKIDSSLKNIRSVKLNKSLFTDPKIISKKSSEYGTPRSKQFGHKFITFPVIVNSMKGKKFGFIYRSDGFLYIYKKYDKSWKEFARLEIHLND